MTIEDVVLAIASIWVPLMDQSAFNELNVKYAFAGTDVFDPGEYAAGVSGSGAIGGQNRFLMPLSFPPQEKAVLKYYKGLESKMKPAERVKGGFKLGGSEGLKATVEGQKRCQNEQPLGHLCLAVAERDSVNLTDIRIVVFDSQVGSIDKNARHQKAHTLAEVPGWLEADRRAVVRDRKISRFIDITVPQHPLDSDSCGLSTILNPRTIMLEIPIHRGVARRQGRPDKQYLVSGLEMINLALGGFMDSRTIQAWMNVYGYSVQQDPTDSTDNISFQVNAIAMTPTRLKEILYYQSLSH